MVSEWICSVACKPVILLVFLLQLFTQTPLSSRSGHARTFNPEFGTSSLKISSNVWKNNRLADSFTVRSICQYVRGELDSSNVLKFTLFGRPYVSWSDSITAQHSFHRFWLNSWIFSSPFQHSSLFASTVSTPKLCLTIWTRFAEISSGQSRNRWLSEGRIRQRIGQKFLIWFFFIERLRRYSNCVFLLIEFLSLPYLV